MKFQTGIGMIELDQEIIEENNDILNDETIKKLLISGP
jgi:hypothetical protein